MQQNPFDQFDGHGSPAAPIILKPADPDKAVRSAILHLDLQAKAKKAAQGETMGNPALTGDAFLQTVPAQYRPLVKLYADNKQLPPVRPNDLQMQLMAAAAQYDPNYDPSLAAVRKKAMLDFAGNGQAAQVVRSVNRLASHLNDMYAASERLGGPNLGIRALNSIVAGIQQQGHPTDVAAYDAAKPFVATELEKIMKGAGQPAVAGVQEALTTMDRARSLDERRAAFKQIVSLVHGALDPIKQSWNSAYGGTKAPPMWVSSQAAGAFGAIDPSHADTFGGSDWRGLPGLVGDGSPGQKTVAAGALPGGGSGPGTGGTGGPSAGGGGFKPVISGPQGGLQKIFNSYQGNAERLDQNVAGGDDAFRSQFDPKLSGELNILIRKFKTPDEINAYLKSRGADPVNPADVLSAQNYLRNVNPSYKASVGYATRSVPNTTWERVSGSPLAATSVAATNAAMLGGMDEVGGAASWLTGGDYRATRDRIDAGKTVLQASHPGAYLLGDVAGSVLPFAAPEALIGKGGSVIAKTLADGGVGAVRGFLENNDNRLGGAVGGAFGGVGGSLTGRAAAVPIAGLARTDAATNAVNAARRLLGKEPLPVTPSLSPAEQSIYSAATKAGPEDVQGALTEAQGLGVPMSLADTHPELRSLAGAAVRRSPTASRVAEGALLPRSRGQIDRFGQAMERDLGPLGNVPQISSDLTASAKTNAAPLYDRAYAAGQVNDPALNELLKHPEMKSAFDAAKVLRDNDAAIARARGEPEPPPLKEMYTFSNSSPTGYELTTPPDVRTLDYIKRGLDGRIRSAFSGADPQAAMQGPFLKDARNLLLSRTDATVPDYAAARAAYAGPMQATDALEAGQNAVRPSVTPDQLGVDMKGASSADIPHLQLGYRAGLMDQANRARYNSNPFAATLGTPAAEQKLGAMYPGNPGVERMLRQRDLEEQLARTTNKVLGGSNTAERHIADQTFASDLPQMAVDGALMLAGQAPVATISKKLSGQGLRNAWDATLGKRAVAKADEMAPTLLDTDPAASLAKLQDLLAKGQAFRDAVQASRQRAQSWLAPLGAAAGVQPALQ